MSRAYDSCLPAIDALENNFPYIKWGGTFEDYKFTNTCVMDSMLAGFHFSYLKNPRTNCLFALNPHLKNIMENLNNKMYNEAKYLWWKQTINFPINEHNVIDFKSNVEDHLPVLSELVCAVNYDLDVNEDEIGEILRIFWENCDVKALGKSKDPDLILVQHVERDLYRDCFLYDLHLTLKDKPVGTYELEFMLLGQDEHMVMCFRHSGDVWVLFDSIPPKPFQRFNLKLYYKDYTICLAGYVRQPNSGICDTAVSGVVPFNVEEHN